MESSENNKNQKLVDSAREGIGKVGQEGESVRREKATFGAGCFWGVQAAFDKIKGVVSTVVGYAGGIVKDPSYEAVCSGQTGHAEVVQIEYDSAELSYEDLLDVFWQIHDPTTLNRQGPDIGTQYRSVIFFHSPEQETTAKASKKELEDSGKFTADIVTEIAPAAAFYRAEEYHQDYLKKHPYRSCGL